MSKAIALVMGGWIMYSAMIGSYGGAIVLLLAYVLIAFEIGRASCRERV